MNELRIDVWSDIACPWCYIGKRRLESALRSFPHQDQIQVVWRAFELDPGAPREFAPSPSYSERLAKKYGSSVKDSVAMMVRVAGIAEQEGLHFDFQNICAGNTFDAHRVLHLARERGVQDAVKERFLRGYLEEAQAIGRKDVLVRLGREAGLDSEELVATLETDGFSREVRADQEEARALGIHGVPFFVLGGRYAVSGAQPAELLKQALARAWADVSSQPIPFAEGDSCGPEGCN